MENELRVEVLATLRQIRSELQGNAEESIICQLDEAIQDLEAAERDSLEESMIHALIELLGKVLENLPAVLALIELLRRLHG